MGASVSEHCRNRKRPSENTWRWRGGAGEHSPFPVDAKRYQGSPLLYCFVDITTTYKIMKNEINLGPPTVTTDIENQLQLITDSYANGFKLDKFVRIPEMHMTTSITDWTAGQPYQAILSKVEDSEELAVDWQLQVQKHILSTKTLTIFGQDNSENELLTKIRQYAKHGARLVCAEPVGYVRSATDNDQYGIIGIELFFDISLSDSSSTFIYHTVTVSANYHIVPDATQTIQQVECNADFLGQLRLFLNKGWRLVDICIDATAIADAYRMRSLSKLVETVWIFEKETKRLYDDTPVYEGVIIEYLHRVEVSLGKERPCRDWRPVIAGMGQSGWQLASIIQTPLLVQSTFTTYTMKLLFIFQRRLVTYNFYDCAKRRDEKLPEKQNGFVAESRTSGSLRSSASKIYNRLLSSTSIRHKENRQSE